MILQLPALATQITHLNKRLVCLLKINSFICHLMWCTRHVNSTVTRVIHLFLILIDCILLCVKELKLNTLTVNS
jgi:hypothetical protein